MALRFFQILLTIGLLSHSITAVAQSSDAALNRLTQAFREGNAAQLMELSAPTIEIGLFGDARQYSRSQATLLMRSFFRSHPPSSFTIDDFTKTGRGWFIQAAYAVGDSTDERVRPQRVYLRLRQNDGDWRIREILIEESRE